MESKEQPRGANAGPFDGFLFFEQLQSERSLHQPEEAHLSSNLSAFPLSLHGP
jgi:hypothetical protein